MSLTLRIDTKSIERRLRTLEKSVRERSTAAATVAGARTIVADAKKRAPTGFTGELKRSAFVRSGQIRDPRGRFAGGFGATFGFSARHAAIMDRGWRTKIILPKRSRGLYIPLTRAAALRGPRKTAGTRAQTRIGPSRPRRGRPRARSARDRRDFIIVPEVRTPRPRAGRRKGPNLYFTSAVRKATRGNSVLRVMASQISAQIRRIAR